MQTFIDMVELVCWANGLTKAATAFTSYLELCAACDGGYVPTIYGTTRRQRLLIKALKSDGYRVWGNKGKNW